MSIHEVQAPSDDDIRDPLLYGPNSLYLNSSENLEMQGRIAERAGDTETSDDLYRKSMIQLYIEQGLALEPLLQTDEAQQAFDKDLEKKDLRERIEGEAKERSEQGKLKRRERRLRAVGGAGIGMAEKIEINKPIQKATSEEPLVVASAVRPYTEWTPKERVEAVQDARGDMVW